MRGRGKGNGKMTETKNNLEIKALVKNCTEISIVDGDHQFVLDNTTSMCIQIVEENVSIYVFNGRKILKREFDAKDLSSLLHSRENHFVKNATTQVFFEEINDAISKALSKQAEALDDTGIDYKHQNLPELTDAESAKQAQAAIELINAQRRLITDRKQEAARLKMEKEQNLLNVGKKLAQPVREILAWQETVQGQINATDQQLTAGEEKDQHQLFAKRLSSRKKAEKELPQIDSAIDKQITSLSSSRDMPVLGDGNAVKANAIILPSLLVSAGKLSTTKKSYKNALMHESENQPVEGDLSLQYQPKTRFYSDSEPEAESNDYEGGYTTHPSSSTLGTENDHEDSENSVAPKSAGRVHLGNDSKKLAHRASRPSSNFRRSNSSAALNSNMRMGGRTVAITAAAAEQDSSGRSHSNLRKQKVEKSSKQTVIDGSKLAPHKNNQQITVQPQANRGSTESTAVVHSEKKNSVTSLRRKVRDVLSDDAVAPVKDNHLSGNQHNENSVSLAGVFVDGLSIPDHNEHAYNISVKNTDFNEKDKYDDTSTSGSDSDSERSEKKQNILDSLSPLGEQHDFDSNQNVENTRPSFIGGSPQPAAVPKGSAEDPDLKELNISLAVTDSADESSVDKNLDVNHTSSSTLTTNNTELEDDTVSVVETRRSPLDNPNEVVTVSTNAATVDADTKSQDALITEDAKGLNPSYSQDRLKSTAKKEEPAFKMAPRSVPVNNDVINPLRAADGGKKLVSGGALPEEEKAAEKEKAKVAAKAIMEKIKAEGKQENNAVFKRALPVGAVKSNSLGKIRVSEVATLEAAKTTQEPTAAQKKAEFLKMIDLFYIDYGKLDDPVCTLQYEQQLKEKLNIPLVESFFKDPLLEKDFQEILRIYKDKVDKNPTDFSALVKGYRSINLLLLKFPMLDFYEKRRDSSQSSLDLIAAIFSQKNTKIIDKLLRDYPSFNEKIKQNLVDNNDPDTNLESLFKLYEDQCQAALRQEIDSEESSKAPQLTQLFLADEGIKLEVFDTAKRRLVPSSIQDEMVMRLTFSNPLEREVVPVSKRNVVSNESTRSAQTRIEESEPSLEDGTNLMAEYVVLENVYLQNTDFETNQDDGSFIENNVAATTEDMGEVYFDYDVAVHPGLCQAVNYTGDINVEDTRDADRVAKFKDAAKAKKQTKIEAASPVSITAAVTGDAPHNQQELAATSELNVSLNESDTVIKTEDLQVSSDEVMAMAETVDLTNSTSVTESASKAPVEKDSTKQKRLAQEIVARREVLKIPNAPVVPKISSGVMGDVDGHEKHHDNKDEEVLTGDEADIVSKRDQSITTRSDEFADKIKVWTTPRFVLDRSNTVPVSERPKYMGDNKRVDSSASRQETDELSTSAPVVASASQDNVEKQVNVTPSAIDQTVDFQSLNAVVVAKIEDAEQNTLEVTSIPVSVPDEQLISNNAAVQVDGVKQTVQVDAVVNNQVIAVAEHPESTNKTSTLVSPPMQEQAVTATVATEQRLVSPVTEVDENNALIQATKQAGKTTIQISEEAYNQLLIVVNLVTLAKENPTAIFPLTPATQKAIKLALTLADVGSAATNTANGLGLNGSANVEVNARQLMALGDHLASALLQLTAEDLEKNTLVPSHTATSSDDKKFSRVTEITNDTAEFVPAKRVQMSMANDLEIAEIADQLISAVVEKVVEEIIIDIEGASKIDEMSMASPDEVNNSDESFQLTDSETPSKESLVYDDSNDSDDESEFSYDSIYSSNAEENEEILDDSSYDKSIALTQEVFKILYADDGYAYSLLAGNDQEAELKKIELDGIVKQLILLNYDGNEQGGFLLDWEQLQDKNIYIGEFLQKINGFCLYILEDLEKSKEKFTSYVSEWMNSHDNWRAAKEKQLLTVSSGTLMEKVRELRESINALKKQLRDTDSDKKNLTTSVSVKNSEDKELQDVHCEDASDVVSALMQKNIVPLALTTATESAVASDVGNSAEERLVPKTVVVDESNALVQDKTRAEETTVQITEKVYNQLLIVLNLVKLAKENPTATFSLTPATQKAIKLFLKFMDGVSTTTNTANALGSGLNGSATVELSAREIMASWSDATKKIPQLKVVLDQMNEGNTLAPSHEVKSSSQVTLRSTINKAVNSQPLSVVHCLPCASPNKLASSVCSETRFAISEQLPDKTCVDLHKKSNAKIEEKDFASDKPKGAKLKNLFSILMAMLRTVKIWKDKLPKAAKGMVEKLNAEMIGIVRIDESASNTVLVTNRSTVNAEKDIANEQTTHVNGSINITRFSGDTLDAKKVQASMALAKTAALAFYSQCEKNGVIADMGVKCLLIKANGFGGGNPNKQDIDYARHLVGALGELGFNAKLDEIEMPGSQPNTTGDSIHATHVHVPHFADVSKVPRVDDTDREHL